MEPPLARDRDVPAVREVNASAAADLPGNRGKVVRGIGAQRAGAKGDAVRRVVDEVDQPLERIAVGDDSRQSEDRPGWIIRMDGHANAGALRLGRHAFEEVAEI